MKNLNSENIKEIPIEKLAAMRNKDVQSSEQVLIEQEFKRRERIHQHELDLKLITKQVKWMKFSVFAILGAALISGIVGYYLATLENKSRDKQQKLLHTLIQENIDLKEMAHHKETIEPQNKKEHAK